MYNNLADMSDKRLSRKPRPVITGKPLLFWNHKLINNTLVHTKHGFVYDE